MPAAAKRPNILMIFADDLGYGDLGCYGNRIIHTPNLDKLAARGTRFTNFYVAAPVCSPSRAALMTGHYAQRYGIHHADLPERLPRYFLPSSAVTIAKVLKSAGYYTAHVGKWHLGEPPETVAPREQGFDYFAGGFGGRPSSPWIKYARSMNPEVIVNENRPIVFEGHVTDVQTAAALDVISKTRRDQPFFLNLWYNAPHEPLAKLEHQKKLYGDWSPEEQTYFQTVTDLDSGIGRVLGKLESLGILNETLIVFSSDNGPEAHSFEYSRGSAGPLKGMKTQLWEGGVREPGILCWPGKVPAGKISAEVTSTLDLFATFCAAAGIAAPKDLESHFSLVDVASGMISTSNRTLFFEFHFPQRGVESSLPIGARSGKWKFFTNHSFDQVQLYDLAEDIGERKDVASSNATVVNRLKQQTRDWWALYSSKANLDEKGIRVPVPSPEELEKKYYKN